MRALTCGIAVAALVTAVALPGTAAAESAGTEYRSGRFVAAQPVRVHDSRSSGPVGSGQTARIGLGAALPSEATAVVLNLTVLGATATTRLTAHTAGGERSGATVHLRPNEIRSAQVTVGIGALSAVDVHNSSGETHVIADLVGYYQAGNGAGFHGATPVRVLDTRSSRSIPAGATRTVDFSARVPAGATAVTFLLTATGTSASHLTAWPAGRTRTAAATLHLPASEARTNLVTVALGERQSVSLYNQAGYAHVQVDLVGYYTETAGAAFRARAPVREYDSRADYANGMPGLPIPPRSRVSLSVAGSVPDDTTGVLLGVTGIEATETTYLTVWADARAPRPEVTAVSVPENRTVANAVVLGLTPGDLVTVYNNAGRVHATVDLLGYFHTGAA
ncbi:hypothetical protein [Actinokineospora sp. UTMC 2448]|uniref:hypothetical protein n=1 Tax=Actinokineospora sp. UTMC 2448 TaxID=2268449 RepID=UPI0021647D37|nr:hypothetical protein [Actinokineospora sp. UTMC 2448]UVS76462.1 hypothetical protein Actkin_00149 [Actinokineospora sp. UTMC 2448]